MTTHSARHDPPAPTPTRPYHGRRGALAEEAVALAGTTHPQAAR